jgi:signal transduction histidine kinase
MRFCNYGLQSIAKAIKKGSLSYDIVKTHGGEIKVETKENEGTEFIIQLPIVSNDR